MSLKKVLLKNFRTCHEVELTDLGHLTVLMGRNGVGKTNVLQGIEWMARTASNLQGNILESTDFKGEFEFCVAGTNYRYSIERLFILNEDDPQSSKDFDFGLQEKLERQDSSEAWLSVLSRTEQRVSGTDGELLVEISQLIPMLPAIEAIRPASETKEHILPVLAYFRGVKYYPLDETAALQQDLSINIITRVNYLEWLSKPNDSIIMRLLNMYLDRRDDFIELNELLGGNGLGVIDSIKFVEIVMPLPHPPLGATERTMALLAAALPSVYDRDRTCYFVEFMPGKGWEGVENLPRLSYGKLSAGTRRIIRILVSFFYDRNSLFLFEQPEDAIHPGLLRKLIDLLRGYDDKGQLIMTSHSSDLFDVLKPEEVRLVTMESGATQVRALSEKELDSAKRYINEEGSLSDFLEMLEDD